MALATVGGAAGALAAAVLLRGVLRGVVLAVLVAAAVRVLGGRLAGGAIFEKNKNWALC